MKIEPKNLFKKKRKEKHINKEILCVMWLLMQSCAAFSS